jgi:hypothetical protein
MRLALQVQFLILLSVFDQNVEGSTAVRGYYIPNFDGSPFNDSLSLHAYRQTDRIKGRF